MERVAGAPSLPVLTERDQRIAQLQQMLRDKELTEDEFLAAMAELRQEDPAVAQSAMAEAGWSPEAIQDILSGVERREGGLGDWAERTLTPGGMEFQRNAAREAGIADRRMDAFDREMGIAMGQIDPEAESAEVMSVPPEEVDQYWDLSEAQRGAKVGAPWGSNTPFKNDYARDQYYERPPLDRNKEAALREAGVPEADIQRARMSQQDLDMMEPGRGSDQGWAMVYAPGHDGRAVPRQRAPVSGQDARGNPFLPEGASLATGGARVGDAVENRDLRDDLQNDSLEAQGYVPTPIRGPNGIEWVYELSDEHKATNKLETDALVANQSVDRLRARAGVTGEMGAPAPGEADNLRSLIRQNRESDRLAQRDAFLKSRMNPRMRAETGLADIGGPEMNDWQNFVLAQNLAQNADPTTPLAADAFMNQQMLRGLQQQMTGRGFNGNDAMAVAMFQAQQEERRLREQKMETWRAKAASYIRSPLGNNAGRARAAVLALGAPPDVADMLIAEMFPDDTAPAEGGSPAAASRRAARRSGGSAWTRPGDPIPR
jgi:hypothetical protein